MRPLPSAAPKINAATTAAAPEPEATKKVLAV
jgi:hypothetical protein